MGSKLHRIDENTNHHDVSQFRRFLHQIQMALMEASHGWNKANGMALLATLI
jgi:hypothetical protein